MRGRLGDGVQRLGIRPGRLQPPQGNMAARRQVVLENGVHGGIAGMWNADRMTLPARAGNMPEELAALRRHADGACGVR
jgi:hypothetical protein